MTQDSTPATAPPNGPGPLQQDLNLGLIGNCSLAALVDRRARVVWACYPRFDGDPVFCSLLNGAENGPGSGDEHGFMDVVVDNFARSEQHYLPNSAILVTTLYDTLGQSLQVIDFAPRFPQFGRMFRPTQIVRIIAPLAGNPRIAVRVRPRFHYGAGNPQITRGSNHIRYVSGDLALRLTTDAPVSYIEVETPFVLEHPVNLIFGADESLRASLSETVREFQEETLDYWRGFVRGLALPFEWQDHVIRAAITLKMCSYEETGAIVAAITTSLPEAPNTERNWDYRFCWLRDAYFSVHALNRLGATKTMEDYLTYITNIVASSPDGYLQPLFSITLSNNLTERSAESLSGFRGMGPVRRGNEAYKQVQNDSYGAVILATAQTFFDRRVLHPGSLRLFERLELLGQQAVKLWNTPDAGPWELRTRERVHTFSAVMCWAGCDRLAKIGEQLGLTDRADHWRKEADSMRTAIVDQAFDAERNTFVESFGGRDLDASLLLLNELGFLAADDPRFRGTVEAVEQHLRHGKYLYRYHAADDFGEPETSFTICTFWYINALAALDRQEEARELFEHLLSTCNHVGLLSEDIHPASGTLWGNFPQTYSMVGMINSAMKLSKTWEEGF